MGLKVFTLDTYDLLDEIKADPAGFGFTNVSDPCWSGTFTDPLSGALCSTDPSDQDKFLFWDTVHPTEAGRTYGPPSLRRRPCGAPEATTWGMMLTGFAGLGFVGWRRRSLRHH